MDNKQKTILIVEDDRPLSRAMQLKLQHSGFKTEAAYDGAQALEIAEKVPVDLILLDLILPEKDGFRVLKELREKNIKVPIVVTTNLSQEEDAKKALSLGAKEYFIKSNTPINTIVDYVRKTV
ncbi:MAG: hypothetical protein A3J48_01850 [Candidatus Doudnabacteria bacterium RIFCSPHIGHO2_02_FULL_46_11]|uniref:Response regulatory domain-containing protein n=1 Tax=Candidatus Doudnabacteria bacterium RIFCSPHIGHO2_02_FULL_46_11 TaxID=1817832 RepID=A0A1F5PA86_9BACT|nr:MAG: hypothetical protein A3J48_01850 [Candidatus Doudnabacteria bacterium RIFCSPHIGHO2_02_FULL_46_11]